MFCSSLITLKQQPIRILELRPGYLGTALRLVLYLAIPAVAIAFGLRPDWSMVFYVGLVVLSLLSCSVGFALESVRGNIRHVSCGRIPNASAAVFPLILVVPSFYVVVAWGINKIENDVGYCIVAAYSIASITARYFKLRKSRAELTALKNGAGGASA